MSKGEMLWVEMLSAADRMAKQHMLPEITLEVARNLMQKAIDTQSPDFTYCPTYRGERTVASCFYFPLPEGHSDTSVYDDDPRKITGCIVGTALKIHGVPEEVLKTLTGSIWMAYGQLHHHVRFTPEAVQYFQAAQTMQDNKKTWGEAQERAEIQAGYTHATTPVVFS